MQDFEILFNRLDQVTGTHAKVAILVDYFRWSASEDAAWTLALFIGKRQRRLITGRRLRDILQEHSNLPDWLIADCYAQVGDSAETISLLWPEVKEQQTNSQSYERYQENQRKQQPLHWWMEKHLPEISQLKGDQQTNAILKLWSDVPENQHFILNKLLTGGFRVGVSSGLVCRALSKAFDLNESLILQRLMGGFEPSAENFNRLKGPADSNEQRSSSRPYPFFLASPLDPERIINDEPEMWQLEWKWDGIRGQMIRRGEGAYLWSRGEEMINESFPELIELARSLPDGTVLDGEIICWRQNEEKPMGFDSLQRRLGRKKVDKPLRVECPICFVAYDLLERDGIDIRDHPLNSRQNQISQILTQIQHPELWRLRQNHAWTIHSWSQLDHERQQAYHQQAEGLMIKQQNSPYLIGRKRGYWWKHKLDPMSLDAVLLYAQAGSGRRANLFTDYTFGLWSKDNPPALISFAKAYSGLNDKEIVELDRWIRKNTLQKFGPVRSVKPEQVFEIGFEGIHRSKRHKSGVAVRFPRILRWRHDKPAEQADPLQNAIEMIRDDSN
ncbi:MAG: ATP-dependent DNA ligase [Cyanobium sp. NAT70]|nr:ATP-dependent DNA ligase [Cyanobium sp. NAT70]